MQDNGMEIGLIRLQCEESVKGPNTKILIKAILCKLNEPYYEIIIIHYL